MRASYKEKLFSFFKKDPITESTGETEDEKVTRLFGYWKDITSHDLLWDEVKDDSHLAALCIQMVSKELGILEAMDFIKFMIERT